MRRLAALAIVAAALAAGQAEATEIVIRVPRPAGYGQPVRLKNARLLLAWWGNTEEVRLAHRYERDELAVTVPLDRSVWSSLGAAQPPDFAYVYLEFIDFAPVQSERFYWIGGNAPAPAPVNWQTVATTQFRFRGHRAVEIRDGERREVSLAVRRPVSKQLRFLDERGRSFPGITVDGGMFWSNANHCGHPSGLEPLFEKRRPNADGTLAIPDGDIEYGFRIDGAPHISVVAPAPVDGGSFFTSRVERSELPVRIRRHRRVPLTVRVSIGGRPAAGVIVGAAVRAACGNGTGPLGRTDARGVLRVPEFYPEEFNAVCIGGLDGSPVWSAPPPAKSNLVIDLPKGTRVGDIVYCYQDGT